MTLAACPDSAVAASAASVVASAAADFVADFVADSTVTSAAGAAYDLPAERDPLDRQTDSP